MQVQVEGSYDPEIGFTVSLSHVEESGFYDCRVRDQEDISIQFQVMVDENSESNEDTSSDDSFADNASVDVPPMDESTTILPLTLELSRQKELLGRVPKIISGVGLTLQKRHGWWLSITL